MALLLLQFSNHWFLPFEFLPSNNLSVRCFWHSQYAFELSVSATSIPTNSDRATIRIHPNFAMQFRELSERMIDLWHILPKHDTQPEPFT
ncbi:hypothetical protein VCR14J2_260403 [Vibrio coralliirubri]|nr:hypothetical protein VCR14J2_260403 [Vibrio coralliirubri]